MRDTKSSEPKQTIRDYIGNAFAALMMLAFMVVAAFIGYWYLMGKGIDLTELTDPTNIPGAIIKLSADCQGLREGIEAGKRCEASDDCVMTSSEFKEFGEAKWKYVQHCEAE
jgi:hypothetical protein